MVKLVRKRFTNMTQKQFAKYCGVSGPTISNVEQGFPIGAQSLLKILRAMVILIEKYLDEKNEQV